MKYLLLTTGGTIDAAAYPESGRPQYSTITGEHRAQKAMQDIAGDAVDAREICEKDSKDINDGDIAALSACVRAATGYSRVIVTTGTDRMSEIAQKLSDAVPALPCPVVFTGAIVPLANGVKSDGWNNLKRAMLDQPDLAPGIYIAMGDVFNVHTNVYKDFEREIFVDRTRG